MLADSWFSGDRWTRNFIRGCRCNEPLALDYGGFGVRSGRIECPQKLKIVDKDFRKMSNTITRYAEISRKRI